MVRYHTIYKFLNVCPFDYTAFAVSGKVSVNRFNHTSWITVVTPTDNPKSVCNRCVIEVFVAILCCQLVFEFSVGIGVFVIGLSQISIFFSNMLEDHRAETNSVPWKVYGLSKSYT